MANSEGKDTDRKDAERMLGSGEESVPARQHAADMDESCDLLLERLEHIEQLVGYLPPRTTTQRNALVEQDALSVHGGKRRDAESLLVWAEADSASTDVATQLRFVQARFTNLVQRVPRFRRFYAALNMLRESLAADYVTSERPGAEGYADTNTTNNKKDNVDREDNNTKMTVGAEFDGDVSVLPAGPSSSSSSSTGRTNSHWKVQDAADFAILKYLSDDPLESLAYDYETKLVLVQESFDEMAALLPTLEQIALLEEHVTKPSNLPSREVMQQFETIKRKTRQIEALVAKFTYAICELYDLNTGLANANTACVTRTNSTLDSIEARIAALEESKRTKMNI